MNTIILNEEKPLRITVIHLFLFLIVLLNYLPAQNLYFTLNEEGIINTSNFDVNSYNNLLAVWDQYPCPSGDIENESDDGAVIYARYFDSTGVMLSSIIRIDSKESSSISNTRPDISINKNNNDVAIVWQKRSENSENDTRTSTIIASILNQNLEAINYQFNVDTTDTLNQTFPKVKYLANNNILVAWYERHNDGQYYFAKIFNHLGEVVTNKFKINLNNISSGTVHLDITSNGFYCTWDSYLQFFDNWGNKLSNAIDAPFQYVNAVKTLTNNEILIIDRNHPYQNTLEGIIYQIDNGIFSSPFRIDDDTTSSYHHGTDISINKEGDYIITWADFRNDNNNKYSMSDIYAQRFDSDNNPIGINFKVNHEKIEIPQRSCKVILLNKHFVVTYLEPDTSSNKTYPGGDAIDITSLKNNIACSIQNYLFPSPGEILGWEYLFPFNPKVGFVYPNPLQMNCDKVICINIEPNRDVLVYNEIYNILGQRIIKNRPQLFHSGKHIISWSTMSINGKDLCSGAYIWKIIIGDRIINRKFTILK